MSWFDRIKKGIVTRTAEKKEVPDGLWYKCEHCKYTGTQKELRDNAYVCPSCAYHNPVKSQNYFELLFDNAQFEELFSTLAPVDILEFSDLKSYKNRLKAAQEKTGLKDAMRVGVGSVESLPCVLCCMDFTFIGGSMGSVMGEKISRAIDYSIQYHIPLMIISKSGGARMMESAFSLMQMAKTAAKLSKLAKAHLPYISLMTDPTTGGVTASFAMLGDLNLAEKGALIGFAGPRVIRETIRKELPDGFQKAEFVLENGFLDMVIDRRNLKDQLATFLFYFKN
ncbi:MAG: acetyl-CoA carboxylase carboxyltransferase subunit beta [Sphingobacteriales bacterium]|nr:acetyl-CoA carboxylase carboxyltransferase subunit beta [Sphingobacteriales bacterium]